MNRKNFINEIIKEGEFHLKKEIRNTGQKKLRIGIEYSSKKWNQIQLNFERLQEEAIQNNLAISNARDGSKCLYFKFIK